MRNEKSEDVTIGMVNIGTAIANIINNTRNEIPGVYDVNITVTLEKLT
jgi:NADH/NAD ratio-sensing transcriptional regulator Rex